MSKTNYSVQEDIGQWRGAVLVSNANKEKNIAHDNLMILVSDIILQLGIPVHTKGYTYLREAIIIKVNNPLAEIPVTKILYPDIAKKFQTSAFQVERTIRHSIGVAWYRMAQSCRDKGALYPFSLFEQKPTNSEFIAMIADHIILHYR